MIDFLKLFIIFFMYSFIGYIVEIIVVSVEFKKITNRGFLCGPICPIYGLGAIMMSGFLYQYKNDYLILFVLGALISTILEYFTGWCFEKIFHNKWWDYSKHKFHVNGRICMSNSICFGLGAILCLKLSNPLFYKFINLFSEKVICIVSIMLILLFILDLVYSWIEAFNLRTNIIIVEELKNNKLNNIPLVIETKLRQRVDSLKLISNRIINNFPKFINKYKKEFDFINKLKEKNKKN